MLLVIELKWLISEIRIRVSIEYVSRKLKALFKFQSNRPLFLIYQCNQKVKKIRLLVENGKKQNKVNQFGSYASFYKRKFVDRSVTEVVYLIDSVRIAREHAKEQLGINAQYCDLGVRNAFHVELLALTMKWFAGFNQYSNQNQQINYGLVSNKCLRYLNCKDWEYIMLCLAINNLKLEFIKILYNKIKKTIYIEEYY